MNKHLQFVIYLLAFTLSFIACDLADNDDPVPAYIVIDTVEVVTTDVQGAPTHNISDIWLFVDGQAVGVWPLPARIPVLPTGDNVQLQFLAGIRADGVSGQARIYPFYNIEERTTLLQPGQNYSYELDFTYSDATQFPLVEGFENRNVFSIDLDGNVDNDILRTQQESRSGNYSGVITVSDSMPIFEAKTQFIYQESDIAGREVYLEIDYLAEVPFLVGTITYGQFIIETFKVLVTENQEWNKIYIDISDEIFDGNTLQYEIKIGSGIEGSGLDSAKIYLDNIKLVHF